MSDWDAFGGEAGCIWPLAQAASGRGTQQAGGLLLADCCWGLANWDVRTPKAQACGMIDRVCVAQCTCVVWRLRCRLPPHRR